jgi:laccase
MATTSVRYRSESPTGYILFKYAGAPEIDMTLDGDLPAHPEWNDTKPTVELEENLFTLNVSSFDDADVLNADAASLRRLILVGNQLNDNSTGKLRWAINNVTEMMGPVPIITAAYDAVTTDGAESWPGTQLSDSFVVPDKPTNIYNYSEPVQDSVGTYNQATGPSYIPFVEGEMVEVVLQNTLTLKGVAEMHSWHLHGHSFYVVGSGSGVFDENTDPASYNLVNPVRRDTMTVLPYGWTAIRVSQNSESNHLL